MRYLGRAVDHEGEVLESFVTRTRNEAAALKFIKRAMKRHGGAGAIVTDGLRSHGATMKDTGNAGRQEVGRTKIHPVSGRNVANKPKLGPSATQNWRRLRNREAIGP